MAWLIHIEEFFFVLAEVGQVLLEAIAILCIFIGILTTAQLVIKLLRRRQGVPFPFLQVRLRFGLWLAMALEFQLGADVLTTTISPGREELTRLAVIAVIRTFLNYFLNKEMETQVELREQARKHNYQSLLANGPESE
ncbi:DUF1622 domain-containing protein [Halomicronema sp. CCY15110]|uniref:DUF1622 domain-containing protein n=1 Tax=Halomicronema sp. CCY15110 TaxID=2767773 RepID=UPI0019511EC9|nr:DUF1622 domain-containing protein [Halomicronema sp. CCY15110]